MVDVYMIDPIFLYPDSESENRISELYSGKKFPVHTFPGIPGNLYRTFSRSGFLTGFYAHSIPRIGKPRNRLLNDYSSMYR